MNAELHC